ncbi:MAG: glycosyltransferase family 2 protein [Roseicyclus sp.]
MEFDPYLLWFANALDAAFGPDAFFVHIARAGPGERPDADGLAAGIEENLRQFMASRANGLVVPADRLGDGFADLARRLGADVGPDDAAALRGGNGAVEGASTGSAMALAPPDPEAETLRRLAEATGRERLLAGALKVARADLAIVEGKLRRYRRHLRYALLPWVIVLFPLTIPAWGWLAWRKRRDDLQRRRRGGLKALDRDHMRTTMQVLALDGVEAACAHLATRPKVVPPGAEALIRAHGAATDAEWTDLTNAWLAHHGPARVTLSPGTAPRFHRIGFAPLEARTAQPEPITVLMPAFNAAGTIEAAVRSILEQTWREVELIVIDDASTDATGEVLDRIARRESRLRVLHNPVNVGPYVSKNAGLAWATCEVVTGHDADDLALPDRLERQHADLTRHGENRAVTGRMIRMSAEGLLNYAGSAGNAFSRDGMLRTASISLMIRRRDLARIGYWDSVRFGADSEMLRRLSRVFGRGAHVTDLLTMLCLNESGSLTNNAEFGISVSAGVSDIRSAYRARWEAWHETAGGGTPLYRAFSNRGRPFDAPERMLVPERDIRAVRAAHGIPD